MDVVSTTGVMTRENSLELSNTGSIGLLDATEEGSVQVTVVALVAVSAGYDTGVDALSVLLFVIAESRGC